MPTTMRRKDRETDSEQTIKLLKEGEYGVLATVDAEGQPYATPLSYVCTNNLIYFHCATEGHKLNNLRANKRVSFCVVGKTDVIQEKFTTNYESSIAFGSASEIFGDEKEKALLLLVKKYSPEFVKEGTDYIARAADKTGVIKIEIKQLTGKARQ